MKRFGLIGHPVAGSFSPKLFEAAYGGRYPYDLLEGADFGVSWKRFLDSYDGINITAPFKEDAFRAVDTLSDNARLCGAVNLAVKTPDGIVGYNTDVDGVILAVRETGLPVSEALVAGLPRHACQPHALPCRRPGRGPRLRLDSGRRPPCPRARPRDLHGSRAHGRFPRFFRRRHPGGELPDSLPGRPRPGLHFRPPLAPVPGRRRVWHFYGGNAGRRCDVPDFLLT